jgi:tetratricopeptide (TPR) repeat protein
MTIALLPFNAGPNTNAPLARQIAYFASDYLRTHLNLEIYPINYLSQVQENPPQFANINPSEQLNEAEVIGQFFQQANLEKVIDGLLTLKESGNYELVYRIFEKNKTEPLSQETLTFRKDELFKIIRDLIQNLAQALTNKKIKLPEDNLELFGTENQKAFVQFLEGYDALQYVDRSQGQVTPDFDPEPIMQGLLEALEADEEWEGPYLALVQLCRACIQLQLGSPEFMEKTLLQIVKLIPEDERGLFVAGEYYEATGKLDKALEFYEKAHKVKPQEPGILARLGMLQFQMGMPANAERTFKKAIELEGSDKPSADLLAQVLAETNRGHEIPQIWKEILEKDPKNAQAHAKYALALFNGGRKEEAIRAFDQALELVEDTTLVKRFYAPVLAQLGEQEPERAREYLDQAMDYYEDCLDIAPSDPQLLLEYARALHAAGREFEVPKILKDLLGLEIDPNMRAQVVAWLIEIEQPQRVETIHAAQKKLESGDFKGVIQELKPLKTWLSDYWKMWAILATAHNRLQEYGDAEQAALQVVNMFPGCEPIYGELVAALTAQDKNEEAYNVMRFAATQIQGSLPIAINLAIAAKRSGREDEAKSLARQIREVVGKHEQLEPVLAELEP